MFSIRDEVVRAGQRERGCWQFQRREKQADPQDPCKKEQEPQENIGLEHGKALLFSQVTFELQVEVCCVK